MDGQTLPYEDIEIEDCSLDVIEGPHKGLRFPLFKDIIDIGRRTELCDLVLSKDTGVSGLHARIQVEQDKSGKAILVIRDLQSRNGILLEGLQVREAYITPGQRFQIGKTVIALEANSSDKKHLTINYYDQSQTLVGRSPNMRRIFTMLDRLARRNVPVMLTGETGTGKSTVAEAIHRQSDRKTGKFVSVNCGALPPSLIESSLFGHERGAFTGADSRHIGYFEQADQGTLFLDELGELPLDMQPKLLDALERKRIVRVGGKGEVAVDFRLVCATNKDLKQEIKEGRFREDLFYRLSVIQLEVPPLRERTEDIPILAQRMLKDLYPESNYFLTEDAIRKLSSYLWPGNVRQLRNVLERTFTFIESDGATSDDIHLPELTGKLKKALDISKDLEADTTDVSTELNPERVPILSKFDDLPLKERLVEFEKYMLIKALNETDWYIPAAAEKLEIAQSWLYKRVKKYDLKR